MNIREYIIKRYHIVLSENEYKELEEYLLNNIEDINSDSELKSSIRNYIFTNLKDKKINLVFSSDNSDLKQALLMLKNKHKNK
ncbi:MAG: hypothetical protein Q8936_01420 [Bacillota bacterium]|nr:hypothetical protein [Bacillota bacterium]